MDRPTDIVSCRFDSSRLKGSSIVGVHRVEGGRDRKRSQSGMEKERAKTKSRVRHTGGQRETAETKLVAELGTHGDLNEEVQDERMV